jgi:hypothetical protein
MEILKTVEEVNDYLASIPWTERPIVSIERKDGMVIVEIDPTQKKIYKDAKYPEYPMTNLMMKLGAPIVFRGDNWLNPTRDNYYFGRMTWFYKPEAGFNQFVRWEEA